MLRLLNENDKTEILGKFSEVDSKIAGGQIVVDKSGTVVTAHDSAEAGFAGLSVFGKSTQDGTPTPTAPVDIVSVEEPNVAVCGKNLFNVNAVTSSSVINNGDGTITVNKVVVQPQETLGEMCPHLKAGDVATFSFDSPAVDNASGTKYEYIYLLGTKESWKNGATKTIKQEMLDGFIYFYASKDSGGNGIATTISNIQVELGNVATEYEPYKEPQSLSVPYTLRGIPVSEGSNYAECGNYTDENGQQWICDEVDFERGVLVQRIFERVFDGVDGETITLYAERANVYGFALKFTDANMFKLAHDARCSHFENIITGISSVNKECFLCGAGSATIYVMIDKSRITGYSVDAFKAWLAENNITILFQLAEPIETALTEEELEAFKALHSNKPNTTVFNDAGTGMAVGYVADAKKYIDNKFEEIKALITAE